MGLIIINLINADGGFFSSYYHHLTAPDQKAVISWDGETEEMIILSSVRSDDLSNLAWVLPIQSSEKPEVEEGNVTIFEELARFFSPERQGFGKNILAPGEGDAGGVVVIEQKEIDVYDITILKATDSQLLLDWLNDNQYKIPEKTKPILDKYVNKGDMYFIANKIDLRNKFVDEIAKINEFKSKEVIRDTYIFDMGINDFFNIINKVDNDYNKDERLSNQMYRELSPNFRGCEFDYERFKNNHLKRYYFLNEDFIKSFAEEYKGFIDCNNDKLNGNQWSQIAESFSSDNPSSNLPDEPGIYGHEYNNGKYKYILVYSNPEIIRKSVNLGFRKYITENQIQFIEENIEDFYSFHMDNKKEIYDSKVKVDGILQQSNLNYDDFKELQDTLGKLNRGLGTPLKIVFKPETPYYPLEISSINQGQTHIEVYVFSDSDVNETNKILGYTETKKITSELREKLSERCRI